MNCEQCRTMLGAEPNSSNPELLAHLETCPECAKYRDEMQAMDQIIYRALAVDAPATRELNAAQSTDSATRQPEERNKARIWRMAASLLLTASLIAGTSVWLLTPRESFAAEVVDHIQHEQRSLVRTSATVGEDSLENVLQASGLRLNPSATRVSYAMSCRFRGHIIPHLVVQTDQGPVTVLVMPEAPSQQRQEINEGGFQGVVMPAPRGIIVVMGKDVPVDTVTNTVLDALAY